MFTILLLISLAAFYCFYLASAKTKLSSNFATFNYLKQNPFYAKAIGYLLLIVSWVVFANLQGLGSGTFAAIVYFMGLGSLVVLLKPYRYLTWSYFLFIVFGFCLLELWFFKF